jgi:uncharacterized membrane protein YbhN (UPF0104 family)
MSSRLRGALRHWRVALLAAGIVAMVLVVRSVGPKVIAQTLLEAAPYLPVLLVLEATWIGMDVFVLRALLGDVARKAPPSAYVRSGISAYFLNVFFPAGRTAGEVMRAAMLSPYLGAATVASGAIAVQGAALLGNSLIQWCALACTASRLGLRNPFVLAIAGSAAATGVLGCLLLFGARAPRLLAFLRARIPSLPDLSSVANDPSSHLGRAVFLSFIGRAAQCLLFTVVVFSITGSFSIITGSIAQGVSLVGSTVGDAVPQQAGVMEGAFYTMAPALGLGETPARAVSIALVVRAEQVLLATIAGIIAALWRSAPSQTREVARPAE